MRLGLGIGVSVAKAAAAAPTAPTDISLSAASLGENSAQATTIGILSATGGTAPYTFSLTDSSSNKVQITGTTLQAGSAAVNFESVTSFNCTVRVTDANTLTFDEVFAITVTNVNETPTDVALSAATLAENSAQGTTIGTLSFTDPDASASGTFTLTDNAGNKVQITGTTLQAGSVAADFETTPSFNCTVLFTDQGGLTRSEVFAITVTDVAEFEAESTALFARMTPTPDATRQGHINTLIAGLKTDGVWTRLHRLWLLAAHSANAARQDWIADTTDLVDVGTPTFTTDRGFAFPGAAATALTTGFSLATNIGAPALGNHSFGGWCTGHTAGGCIIGHTSGRIQTQTAAGAPFTRCSDTTTSGPAHKRVQWTTICGDMILYNRPSPYQSFTVTPFFPYFRRGTTRGAVDDLIDPQIEKNKRRNVEIEIVSKTGNGGWSYHEDSMNPEQKRKLKDFGSTPGFQMEWKGDHEPKQLGANVSPAAHDRLEQKADLDLRSISGINESALGQLDKVQSGRAIEARQRQAVIAIQMYMDNFTSAVENAIRIAAYRALTDRGVPKQKAATIARELTVNFNRKGTLGPSLNAVYMFYNAAIQGNVRLVQSIYRSRMTRLAVIAGLPALGFLEALLAAAGDDDDEDEYKKVDDWVRERNLVIMLHPLGIGKPGQYVKLPMPYGFNVFKVIGTEAGRVALHGTKPMEGAVRVMSAIFASFNPISGSDVIAMIAPTIIDPLVEIARNKNFFGSTIKPDYPNDKRPQSEQYYPNVNNVAKAITTWLNETSGGNEARAGVISPSPEHVEHVIGAYLGGVGRVIMNAQKTASDLLAGRPIDPAKAPFLRQVYGDTIGEMPTYRAYKAALDQTEALEYEIEELGKDGKVKESKEARERDPILTGLIGPMNNAAKAIKELRKQEKAIRDSQLSDDQKENRLLVIRKRQTEIQRKVLDRWDDAHRTRS